MEKDNSSKKHGLIVDSVIFFASFSVYFPLIYFGTVGFGFGMQGAVYYYGLEAILLFSILIWPYTVIVLLCFIGQIRFAVKNLREHRALRNTAIAVAAFTTLCFLSVIPISNNKKKADAANDIASIKECLGNRYGEEFVADIRIEKDNSQGDSYERYYRVYTDVLPSDVYFTVHNDMPSNTYFIDDLMEVFKEQNEMFEDKLKTYISDKYDVPNDMQLRLKIRSIDFKDFCDGDGLNVLFERTDYVIDMIYMNVDGYSFENINGCISRVWKDVYPKINDKIERLLIISINYNYRDLWVEIYYADDGKPYAEIVDNKGFEDTAEYNGMIIELK